MSAGNPESWQERLETLLAASRMNELAPAERAELNDILRAHEEARRAAARWLLDEAALADCLRRSQIESLVREEAQSLVPASGPGARRSWPRGWVSLAAAACFAAVAALVSVSLLTNASASPTAILKHALEAHSAMLDRCYRVEVQVAPGSPDAKRLPATFESRLWTRGDRFWIETRTGERSVAWGREARGAIWFALSSELGVRLEADEVGERLALHCELRALQVESLLHTVLTDFDLRREPGGPGLQVIHAQLKAGGAHPLYRAALLEVDTESGVVRRVVLDRVHRGRPAATVTFTLLETGLQSEAAYTMAGHLAPQAKVYDRQTEPDKRGPLLARFFNALWAPDATR